VGHVACTGDSKDAIGVWLAKLRKRNHLDLQEVGW